MATRTGTPQGRALVLKVRDRALKNSSHVAVSWDGGSLTCGRLATVVGGLVNDLLQQGVHTTDTRSDYWCMARWVEINTGNPVYRIRDDRVVDINTGNPVYRMRE